MCMPWGRMYMGRMHGFGWWCPCYRFFSVEEEIKALEEYKKILGEEIEAVDKRIKELKK